MVSNAFYLSSCWCRWRELLLLVIGLFATPAMAGFLWEGGVSWDSLSFRPQAEEPTPNYYGYGVNMRYGYSVGGILDFAAHLSYTPMQRNAAGLGQEDLQWLTYGAGLGARFGQSVYIGVKGLVQNYDLLHHSGDDEVDGVWAGNGGVLTLGGFWPVAGGRGHMMQASIDVGMGSLRRQDENAPKRTIETFGVGLTYVFSSPEESPLWKRMSGFFHN